MAAVTDRERAIDTLQRLYDYAWNEQQIAIQQQKYAREVQDFRAMDRHICYSSAMQKMHQKINGFARELYGHDVTTGRPGYEIVPEAKMAANTFTIELSDQDRRRIDALCKAMCPTGTVAVVVYVETVGFTDGVHLFSSVDDAERWMLQEIRQHGGEQSHLTLDEFQKRLKPNEDFWIVDVHDRRR